MIRFSSNYRKQSGRQRVPAPLDVDQVRHAGLSHSRRAELDVPKSIPKSGRYRAMVRPAEPQKTAHKRADRHSSTDKRLADPTLSNLTDWFTFFYYVLTGGVHGPLAANLS